MVNEVEVLPSAMFLPDCLQVLLGNGRKKIPWCQEFSSFRRDWDFSFSNGKCCWRLCSYSVLDTLSGTEFSECGCLILLKWIFLLRLLLSLSTCHLLRMYSPISLRVFENTGQVCVWGNPTGRMCEDIKNIILRNEKAQEIWIIFLPTAAEQKLNLQATCYKLFLCNSAEEKALLKLMCSLDSIVQRTIFHNAVFIM